MCTFGGVQIIPLGAHLEMDKSRHEGDTLCNLTMSMCTFGGVRVAHLGAIVALSRPNVKAMSISPPLQP